MKLSKDPISISSIVSIMNLIGFMDFFCVLLLCNVHVFNKMQSTSFSHFRFVNPYFLSFFDLFCYSLNFHIHLLPCFLLLTADLFLSPYFHLLYLKHWPYGQMLVYIISH